MCHSFLIFITIEINHSQCAEKMQNCVCSLYDLAIKSEKKLHKKLDGGGGLLRREKNGSQTRHKIFYGLLQPVLRCLPPPVIYTW